MIKMPKTTLGKWSVGLNAFFLIIIAASCVPGKITNNVSITVESGNKQLLPAKAVATATTVLDYTDSSFTVRFFGTGYISKNNPDFL